MPFPPATSGRRKKHHWRNTTMNTLHTLHIIRVTRNWDTVRIPASVCKSTALCVCVCGWFPSRVCGRRCGWAGTWCVSVARVSAEGFSSESLACTGKERGTPKINTQLNQVLCRLLPQGSLGHAALLGERNSSQNTLSNPSTSSKVPELIYSIHLCGHLCHYCHSGARKRVKQSLQSKWISQAWGSWMDAFSEMLGPIGLRFSSGGLRCVWSCCAEENQWI